MTQKAIASNLGKIIAQRHDARLQRRRSAAKAREQYDKQAYDGNEVGEES